MNPLVVVEQLLLLMLVMLIGYSVARMKLLDDHAEMNFATLINYVTVPAFIFVVFISTIISVLTIPLLSLLFG